MPKPVEGLVVDLIPVLRRAHAPPAASAILEVTPRVAAAVQLATSMALGGYYHLDYNSLDASVTVEQAEELMGENVLCWDFIQRMGYIHDLLLEYTIQDGRGASEQALAPLKTRINALWLKFVGWCEKNAMLDLLKYKLDPYVRPTPPH